MLTCFNFIKAHYVKQLKLYTFMVPFMLVLDRKKNSDFGLRKEDWLFCSFHSFPASFYYYKDGCLIWGRGKVYTYMYMVCSTCSPGKLYLTYRYTCLTLAKDKVCCGDVGLWQVYVSEVGREVPVVRKKILTWWMGVWVCGCGWVCGCVGVNYLLLTLLW